MPPEARGASANGPGFRATVAALAFGQLLSWATLDYGFSSFVIPMQLGTVLVVLVAPLHAWALRGSQWSSGSGRRRCSAASPSSASGGT